ncbi:MAG TPA: hypothetical protein VF939_21990 [Puia sp.]
MRSLFFIFLILSFFAGPAQAPFNGNLEALDSASKPIGWDLTFDGQNTYDVKLDSLVRRQGKFSISISSGNSQAGFGAINFPIHQRYQGKTLMLVGNIKTEGIIGGWGRVGENVNGMIEYREIE